MDPLEIVLTKRMLHALRALKDKHEVFCKETAGPRLDLEPVPKMIVNQLYRRVYCTQRQDLPIEAITEKDLDSLLVGAEVFLAMAQEGTGRE